VEGGSDDILGEKFTEQKNPLVQQTGRREVHRLGKTYYRKGNCQQTRGLLNPERPCPKERRLRSPSKGKEDSCSPS